MKKRGCMPSKLKECERLRFVKLIKVERDMIDKCVVEGGTTGNTIPSLWHRMISWVHRVSQPTPPALLILLLHVPYEYKLYQSVRVEIDVL